MTSKGTHDATVNFFTSNNFFGLPESQVFFFQQATIPCLTEEGKMMLETSSSLARSPNGNGGIYSALSESGALSDMETRGVEFVFFSSVDNALVQICKPEFMGYCALNNVDFGNMVLVKSDPHEKVGVMAIKDGVPGVVEYSELSQDLAELKDDDGQLALRAANIAIHCMSLPFLKKITGENLPFHLARKKIPVVSEDGSETIRPTANNGIKLEMFIFDALKFAENPVAFMVPRFGNFSPVKNAPGAGSKDSPDTARADLYEYHKYLVKNAGGLVEDNDSVVVEISPLRSYDGENLEELSGQIFNESIYIE
jgi:UDP-N-acetylglucosamine/UDP-N-acetylgalactosamine diphosphorylase